ncbi:MAG: alpha/beta hydrolase [Candidatus Roizmanbacteria bacterium]|nr:alpha/beta hydrolase [Candidatus Roizmanbacteria bacterium]
MDNTRINILHIWTEDNLRLQGVHYDSGSKNTCVLCIHGMSGNFIENYFASVLGDTLSNQNIGFVYGHNRGYNHINDIVKKEADGKFKTVRIGAMYERFEESINDIDAWLNEVKRLGYKKVVLLGHSLGCNKTIYFYSKKQPKDIAGVVLASPPDMVGLFEKTEYQPNHKELLSEAISNIKDGNPRKLVSGTVWDWYQLSSQTYFDLSETKGLVDNLPVLRSPDKFEELSQINVPILGIMGELDDIAIKTLEEDMDLIASKAEKCPSFTKEFIKGANHTYDQQEEAFAKVVTDWVKKL